MDKKIKISVCASFILAVTLNANEEYRLSQVEIYSATKNSQSIKDVTSNVNVITSQEIEDRGYTTLIEALNSLSGISFSSNGGIGSTTSLYLRGNDNQRVLILIDGVKYKDNSSLSGSNFSNILLNNVDRIEVIKGAQSGIWGPDASAGVINIITKGIKKGFNANINLEAGSFNTYNYGTTLSYGNDFFDILVGANRFQNDGFTTFAPRGKNIDNFEDDAYENTELNLKANLYFNNYSKAGFFITNVESQKDYDGGFPTDPNDNLTQEDIKSTLYSIYYDVELKNHNINLRYDNSRIKRDFARILPNEPQYNETRTQNIELKDVISYNDNDFFIIGGGYIKEDLNYINFDKTTSFADNSSKNIYATNSNKFGKLIFTQSLRYDNYDNFDSVVTGKAGLKYNILEDLAVFSNYGTSYIPPLLIQNIGFGTSNFNIKPEEGKSFDIGFSYKNFSATYFNQKIDNLIVPTVDFMGYENVDGTTTLKGVELEYGKSMFDAIYLSLNYTNLSARDNKGDYLLNRPKNTFKFGVDYYGIENLNISLFGEYVGSRYSPSTNFGEPNVQTGRYTVWNSTINYDVNKNINLYLKLENITDKYYQIVDGYATAPRSAYIGLRATF